MRQLLKGFLVLFLACLVVGLPEAYMSQAQAARPVVAQRNAIVGWQTVAGDSRAHQGPEISQTRFQDN